MGLACDQVKPVLRQAAHVILPRAGDHRLGRGAPRVDADAAELVTLDERHLVARLGQLEGEEPAALAGSYHDRVVVLIGHCVVSPRRLPHASLAVVAVTEDSQHWHFPAAVAPLLCLWQRLLGRPASESGTLCHGTGPTDGATAAAGRSCYLSS